MAVIAASEVWRRSALQIYRSSLAQGWRRGNWMERCHRSRDNAGALEQLPSNRRRDCLVKERPAICACGTELNPDVSFTPDDRVAFSQQYDLVVAAGSLQYSPDWREISDRLAASAKDWLLFSQLPVTDPAHPSLVVRQRLRRIGIAGDSTCWIIDKREFLDRMHRCGFVLVREFLSAPLRRVAGAGTNSTSTTLLLRRS